MCVCLCVCVFVSMFVCACLSMCVREGEKHSHFGFFWLVWRLGLYKTFFFFQFILFLLAVLWGFVVVNFFFFAFHFLQFDFYLLFSFFSFFFHFIFVLASVNPSFFGYNLISRAFMLTWSVSVCRRLPGMGGKLCRLIMSLMTLGRLSLWFYISFSFFVFCFRLVVSVFWSLCLVRRDVCCFVALFCSVLCCFVICSVLCHFVVLFVLSCDVMLCCLCHVVLYCLVMFCCVVCPVLFSCVVCHVQFCRFVLCCLLGIGK
jgi:hypothetical protein